MDMLIQKDVQELFGPMGLFLNPTAGDSIMVKDFHGGKSAAKWLMANVYQSQISSLMANEYARSNARLRQNRLGFKSLSSNKH